ncbi:non-specific serine/threonine protein kinase [Trifolium repens]|nr:non-specific serine/threonine protein kinase [Trifolium repens]
MIFDDYEAKLLMNRHPKLDSKNINVDRFGLDEIIHFCATFGEYTKMVRGKTSLFKSLSPDVFHLINSLFSVPKAVIVHSNHITFWSSVKKMNFCCEANNKMFDVPFAQILALEINKKIIHGGNESWKLTIDNKTSELWDVVTFEGGNLNDTWTRDLIRFIRNAYQHRDGEKIKELIGKTPTEFDKFFSSLFPHLFVRIYEVASFYWLNDEVFRRFLLCDFYT